MDESPTFENLTQAEPGAKVPHLVVGLGNPGADYATHRHNIGFRVVDALARAYTLPFFRQKSMQAHVAEGQIEGCPVLLAKPKTFMNLSGRAVRRLRSAHNVPLDKTLVIYDDLDLPLGRVRLRPGGGSGGHKGMRSIIEQLGTEAFPRLRVGIGRPPGRMDAAEYVLQPFDQGENAVIPEIIEQAVAAIECWLLEGIVSTMDKFNRPIPTPDSTSQENQA